MKPRRGVSCGRRVPDADEGCGTWVPMLGNRPTETRLITPGPGSGGGWPPRLRRVRPACSPVGESAASRGGKQPRKTPEENLGGNPARQPQPPTHATRRRRVLGDTGTHSRRETRRLLRRHVPNPPSRRTSEPTIGAPGRLGARTRRSIPNTCRNQDATDPRRQPQQGNRCARTPTDKDTHTQTRREARNVLCVGVQEGGVVGRVFGVVVGTAHGLFVLVGALGGWVTGCTGGWYSRWYSSPAIFS